MKLELYKSVTTDRKVSFIEAARIEKSGHPVMLRMSKQEWLDLGRPEQVTVEVTV